MSSEPILIDDADGVRTLTLNRPDKLNALNRDLLQALDRALAAVEVDAAVRVVVLTGAGPKAFAAGADIAELAELSPVRARDFSQYGQRLFRRLETLGKPVIAAINGFALGGGLELAMSCHLRIAADSAKLGQPEVNLGLLPGYGGTQRLLRLTSRAAALELCLLGTPIGAERAYQLGIVNRVVPAAELAEAVAQIARQLAASAPQALRGILDAILHGGECALDQGLEFETQAFALCTSTEDCREGTRAFLDKRKPRFVGR